jgi:hypothetical protein
LIENACKRQTGTYSWALSPVAELPELSDEIVRFLYKCYIVEGTAEIVRSEQLLNLLIAAGTSESDCRQPALMVLAKLSLDGDCALVVAKSPRFTSANLRRMVVDASNGVLLKLIRNIVDRQPGLIRGLDAELVRACLQSSDKHDCLIELFAIANRAKMTSDRAVYFVKQRPFVKLFVDILRSAQINPQLHLEIVMFISAIVLYSEVARVLSEFAIVALVANLFTERRDDLDMQTQCLFAFYRFACHVATRNELAGRVDVMDLVIQHSTSKNAVVNKTANSVLDVLGTFDEAIAARLRLPRFDTFNHEWLQAVGELGTNHSGDRRIRAAEAETQLLCKSRFDYGDRESRSQCQCGIGY